MIRHLTKPIALILFLFICCNVYSQGNTQGKSLKELLQLAEVSYPLLKSKTYEVQAAQRGIDISKNTIIPSLDASYQLNYATYNNITGMAFPQFLIPISGPPSASNNMSGVFGSAASLLLNWQPVTFGQRKSQVDFAQAGFQYSTADAANEIFKHKIKVIDAWLDVLMATELVKVYEENIRRTQASLSLAKTLVVTGIKPGVDSALLKAEVSRAKVDWLNGKKFMEQAITGFAMLLASEDRIKVTDTSYFRKLPSVFTSSDSVKNPLVSLYNSSMELSRARKKVLTKTTLPTLGVWGSTYARGSGISHDGTAKAAEGLGFQRYNYGLGLQISVPILQFARLKPQLQQQEFIINANQEKLNEISLQLKKQNELADTALNNSLAIARESPLYYESALFAFNALRSRYQSGLANFADLMQAQYALIKAETDYKITYMSVWKALLYKAAITGDLNLFLNQVN